MKHFAKRTFVSLFALVVTLATFTSILSAPPTPKTPPVNKRGSLVLVGGGSCPDEAVAKFIALAGGKKARIVLIPTASSRKNLVKTALANWANEDIAHLDCIHTTDRAEANSEKLASKIKYATGVWFGGGDQTLLCNVYRNTTVSREIEHLLKRGGVVGGTSAGASCVSQVMISDDIEHIGFGFLPEYIVDQHFDAKNRLNRLLNLAKSHPELIGIGIDESTALIVEEDKMSVVGVGGVSFCQYADKPVVRVRRKGDCFSPQYAMGN